MIHLFILPQQQGGETRSTKLETNILCAYLTENERDRRCMVISVAHDKKDNVPKSKLTFDSCSYNQTFSDSSIEKYSTFVEKKNFIR